MGFFLSFIPEKVKNRTVVRVLDRMRHIGRRMRIGWKHAGKLAEVRSAEIQKLLKTQDDRHSNNTEQGQGDAQAVLAEYIENQHNLGMIKYGRSDMAYAGCEVIAVYNALRSMGEEPGLDKLINHFERDGMVLSGRFGTAPMAIKDYFRKEGFKVEETLDPDRFDEIAENSDVSVIMFYNDRRSILSKVHTVCITGDAAGRSNTAGSAGYIAHNVYGNGVAIGPYDSVSALLDSINGGYSKGIVLFGISKAYN